MVGGNPALFLDRHGKRVRTMAGLDDEAIDLALDALPQVARRSRRRALTIEEVDGERANQSPLGPRLRARGFTPDYRGLRMEA